MSNRHSFKLQFDGRIGSNCRGLNNIKVDQDYNEVKNSNGESGIKYNFAKFCIVVYPLTMRKHRFMTSL